MTKYKITISPLMAAVQVFEVEAASMRTEAYGKNALFFSEASCNGEQVASFFDISSVSIIPDSQKKVYVLINHEMDDHDTLFGIFSTREKAELSQKNSASGLASLAEIEERTIDQEIQ